jgi:hypothetical protein
VLLHGENALTLIAMTPLVFFFQNVSVKASILWTDIFQPQQNTAETTKSLLVPCCTRRINVPSLFIAVQVKDMKTRNSYLIKIVCYTGNSLLMFVVLGQCLPSATRFKKNKIFFKKKTTFAVLGQQSFPQAISSGIK